MVSGDLITDKECRDVINKLDPNELHRLYSELGMSTEDVEKAKYKASGKTVELEANAVFNWWKKGSPSEATRNNLLAALERCKYNLQKQQLEEEWNK